jgi:hypothetical protein
MKLTVKNLKEMNYNGSKWVLNGKTVEAYKSWGIWNKYDVVENNEVVGTLEYKVGEGFVVIMNGNKTRLADWQNQQVTSENIEVKEVEVVKELGDSTIKAGDKVNVNGQVLTVKSDGEIVDDIDYGKMFKRIMRYENTDLYTFGTTVYK